MKNLNITAKLSFLSLTLLLSVPSFANTTCGKGLEDVKNVNLQLECKGASANSAKSACVLRYENTQGDQVVYVSGGNRGNFRYKSSEVESDQYSLQATVKRKMAPGGNIFKTYSKIDTAKVEKLDSETPTLKLKGTTKTLLKESVDYESTFNCSVVIR